MALGATWMEEGAATRWGAGVAIGWVVATAAAAEAAVRAAPTVQAATVGATVEGARVRQGSPQCSLAQ